jgi:type VI secretion system protein ImpA
MQGRGPKVPLRDDLLNPIPGDNPSGVSLRYERVYDQIKEARIEDDESLPSGDWQRQVKRADFRLVIKLAGEALAARSKDLQLAAWLAEAHLKQEGVTLVQPCLDLFRELQQHFWEPLYPEIDDGDVGIRAGPIEWAANRIAQILREAPLTHDGRSFYQYRDSRAVGYEADVEYNDSKREARNLAIADGKLTAEEFDKSFASTPKTWYAEMDQNFHSAMEALESLQSFCEVKYGDDSPGFGRLRSSLEEVAQVIAGLQNEKRKLEPDAQPVDEVREVEYEAEPVLELVPVREEGVTPSPAPSTRPAKSLSAEPIDRDDAIARVQACAKFLHEDNAASPVAYLLQTSLRLGELREQGISPAWDFLVPPATETRQCLKRLATEENWHELRRASIAAAGEPCGRAWLDVHRYIWKASSEAG